MRKASIVHLDGRPEYGHAEDQNGDDSDAKKAAQPQAGPGGGRRRQQHQQRFAEVGEEPGQADHDLEYRDRGKQTQRLSPEQAKVSEQEQARVADSRKGQKDLARWPAHGRDHHQAVTDHDHAQGDLDDAVACGQLLACSASCLPAQFLRLRPAPSRMPSPRAATPAIARNAAVARGSSKSAKLSMGWPVSADCIGFTATDIHCSPNGSSSMGASFCGHSSHTPGSEGRADAQHKQMLRAEERAHRGQGQGA